MPFEGGCHCGAIRYTCRADPVEAMVCNCSICRKNGSILHFVAVTDFDVTVADGALGTYQFYRHIITHHFCKSCGTSVYAEVAAPRQVPNIAINLRSADLAFEGIPTHPFDGAAM